MSFMVDVDTRLIVQGITGREGMFHTEQMLAYKTNVIAGVTPGKGGTTVAGVPVFNTVLEAREKTQANASVLFVPPRFLYDAAFEAIASGIPLVLTVAEGTPVHDMLKLHHLARQKNVTLIGPNSFGVISPGKAKAGFMAHHIFAQGNVGIMSRSATNCYETVFLMKQAGMGQSTVIGVGGDMIPGSTFVDLLPLYQADEQTEVIIIIGEIGGSEEELAAACIKKYVSKPVIALIAGKNAPKGTSMGHAGAIVSPDGEGSAASKEEAFQAAGVRVAESTQDIIRILKELL